MRHFCLQGISIQRTRTFLSFLLSLSRDGFKTLCILPTIFSELGFFFRLLASFLPSFLKYKYIYSDLYFVHLFVWVGIFSDRFHWGIPTEFCQEFFSRRCRFWLNVCIIAFTLYHGIFFSCISHRLGVPRVQRVGLVIEFDVCQPYMNGKKLEVVTSFKYPGATLCKHGTRSADSLLVSWCFEPSQPQRITPGLLLSRNAHEDRLSKNSDGWIRQNLSKQHHQPRKQVHVLQVSCHFHSILQLWDMDPACWLWEKDPGFQTLVPEESSPSQRSGRLQDNQWRNGNKLGSTTSKQN